MKAETAGKLLKLIGYTSFQIEKLVTMGDTKIDDDFVLNLVMLKMKHHEEQREAKKASLLQQIERGL